MEGYNSERITSEEMAILDNNSEWLGIPKSHLMECAGYSFATEIINKYNLDSYSKVLIFCGTGNNGGDGFVVARHLNSFGVKSIVVLVGNPEKISTEEAKLNWEIIRYNLELSITIKIIKDSTDIGKIGLLIEQDKNIKLIVDALLGTGIKGRVREPTATVIDFINEVRSQFNIKVVSIDVPSGLNPNTGEVLDKAIKADLVITFHKIKVGLHPKTEYINELIVRSIGVPQEAALFVGRGDLLPTLKIRETDYHKGQFGRLLVIGGSKNYSGAPAYSSLTCINFGCDLVITYVPEIIGNVIRNYSPNLIVRQTPGDWLTDAAFEELKPLLDWSNSLIIGPGLGVEKDTENFLVEILNYLKKNSKPYVLDADALKLIKNHLNLIKSQNVILTPHAGEFKIMTDVDLPSYNHIEERGKIIFDFAQKFKITLLVKGPYDYITNGVKLKINRTGCPEMSIGGTGDVLAGLCGCFLATNNKVFDSACSAAFFNGYLGEYCKQNIGQRFNAMDMIKNIDLALLSLQKY
ncbi:MAG: NAD(P)H-hydrate dehydratase [Candidatus Heimdallarchaeota archaeon]